MIIVFEMTSKTTFIEFLIGHHLGNLLLLMLAVLLFSIGLTLFSLYRQKRADRQAAEDRLRRQRAYEAEFADLPETERRIKVHLALQADMFLPRIERRAPRLTD